MTESKPEMVEISDEERKHAKDSFSAASLRAQWIVDAYDCRLSRAERERGALKERVERLEAECRAWRECAIYDATMGGPIFKGWNRSMLDRLRRAREALAPQEAKDE